MSYCKIIERQDVPAQLTAGEDIVCADLNEKKFTNLLACNSGYILMLLADKDCIFFKNSKNRFKNERKEF